MSSLEPVVPKGHKQTDIGIVPFEWSEKSFGDICVVNQGLQIPIEQRKKRQTDSSKVYITIQSLNSSNEPEFIETYSPSVCCIESDILMTRTGNTGIVVHGVAGVFHNNFFKLRFDRKKINDLFLVYYLRSNRCQKTILDKAGTSTIPDLNHGDFYSIKLALPKYKEQTAIANALSDVDTLLMELENLIAKKQAIKTATMQQLLTGKTRLPQFASYATGDRQGQLKGTKFSELDEIPEDWEVVDFGNLFEQTIKRKPINSNVLTTFVGMQDVSESAQLASQKQIYFEKVKSGFTYFEKGDVLLAKITPCFENGKGCHTQTLNTNIGFGSTEFHVLRAKNSADSNFIYFWTTRDNLRKDLEGEMVGSAGHRRVPFSAVQDYKIPCPNSKTEQTAIATILSDMDNEIQTLEQRLAKTCQIKQGMMQELLTGRTRLPFDKN